MIDHTPVAGGVRMMMHTYVTGSNCYKFGGVEIESDGFAGSINLAVILSWFRGYNWPGGICADSMAIAPYPALVRFSECSSGTDGDHRRRGRETRIHARIRAATGGGRRSNPATSAVSVPIIWAFSCAMRICQPGFRSGGSRGRQRQRRQAPRAAAFLVPAAPK